MKITRKVFCKICNKTTEHIFFYKNVSGGLGGAADSFEKQICLECLGCNLDCQMECSFDCSLSKKKKVNELIEELTKLLK